MTTQAQKYRNNLISAIGTVMRECSDLSFQEIIKSVFDGKNIPADDKDAYDQIIRWMINHGDS